MRPANIFRGDHKITVLVHPDMFLKIKQALILEGLLERVTLKTSKFIKGSRVVYVISNDNSNDRVTIEGEDNGSDE